MARIPVNDEILHRAQERLKSWGIIGSRRTKLRKIVDGKITSIDVEWWREVNGVARWQIAHRLKTKAQPKLNKIKAMTDPALNPNQHQRQVAEATLASLQAKLQAEIDAVHLPPVPGIEEHDRQVAETSEMFDAFAAAIALQAVVGGNKT